MEDTTAALKIQKVYKGHKTREKIQSEKGSAVKIQKVFRGHKMRQQQSATKIQAVFRGHLERKRFAKLRPKVLVLQNELGDVQQTLAMIKPDAVSKGIYTEVIKKRITDDGFTIVLERLVQLSQTSAEEFYEEHSGKSFFEGLVTHMSSGPVRVMILARVNAISRWRKLMGPTLVDKAKQESPNSLRALYGEGGPRNSVHGSDSPASAQREIHFFFPRQPMYNIPSGEQTHEYIAESILPVLTNGLTALSIRTVTREALACNVAACQQSKQTKSNRTNVNEQI